MSVATNSIEGQYCRKQLFTGLREAWQETGLKHLAPYLGIYLDNIRYTWAYIWKGEMRLAGLK